MKIVNHLYDGTVQLEFDSFKHRYTVNGKEIPSVTKVLGLIAKPALINWAANMAADCFKSQLEPGKSYDEMQIDTMWSAAKKAHFQKKVDAGTLGSFVHKWVESYIKGENPALPINEEMAWAVGHFIKWVRDHNVKFLLSEQPIYSKQHEYSGTADFICEIDGKLWLGDLKTSSGVYDEYKMQTAAYLNARCEEYKDERYAGCVIVRVGKEEGDFEAVPFTDTDSYFEAFLHCLNLHKSLELIKVLEMLHA